MFVRDVTIDPSAAAIVAAIITLSHDLDLAVVAEGVETEEQLQFLMKLGCDRIQGYYFSAPLPVEEVEAYLARPRQPLPSRRRTGPIELA
jgi:EAL domain-containing protein (putative c-di-GMP-specific phosphodiesterase class I)